MFVYFEVLLIETFFCGQEVLAEHMTKETGLGMKTLTFLVHSKLLPCEAMYRFGADSGTFEKDRLQRGDP